MFRFFFFFFQAEDGIRDFHVTGVQTCALPILGGFTTFCGAYRSRANKLEDSGIQIGADFKDAISEAGEWYIYMYMQGETIPKESSTVSLSRDRKSVV